MSIKIRHKVIEIFICYIKWKNLNITNGTVHWCDVFRVSNELKNLCARKRIVLLRNSSLSIVDLPFSKIFRLLGG